MIIKVFTEPSVKIGRNIWINQNIEESIALGQFSMAFTEEIFTIVSALFRLLSQGLKNKDVCIASGSKKDLRAISRKKARETTSTDSEQNRICLFWDAGHTDILGNEIADRLSKLGRKRTFIGPQPVTGVLDNSTEIC